MVTDLFSFYRSDEWRRFRETVLLKRVNADGELICECCGKSIIHRYDAILHHKIELNELNVNDYSIALNESNVMVVCHACHNKIHDRFGNWQRHIYIVWGSPCAGKSAYVKANAGRHDLIVDVDELYQAISNNPLHDKSNRLTANVLQIRNNLIDMIRTRNGQWVSAWIITSKCRPMELQQLASSVSGELIHIDTDKDTCLQRAEERGDAKQYKKFIVDYFKDYELYKDLLAML